MYDDKDYRSDAPLTTIGARLPDGQELEPIQVQHNYLWDTTCHIWKPHQLAEWKVRLGESTDEIVKKTFLATTQLVPSIQHENEQFPKDYHIGRFPMLSTQCLRETLYCDIVEHAIGKRKFFSLMFYLGTSKIKAIYPLGIGKANTIAVKTVDAVCQFVIDHGDPQKIVSDYASSIAKFNEWKTFARQMLVKLESSEAHKHNQNHVECAWQDLCRKADYIAQRHCIPAECQFDLMSHLCNMHNHTTNSTIGFVTPLQKLTGKEPDLSFVRFHFWEPVWYIESKAAYPERKWVKGCYCGTSWSIWDLMCYKVYPDTTEKQNCIVHRSLVLPRNPDKKVPKELIKYPSDHFFPTPKIDPKPQLEGRNNQDTGGKRKRADGEGQSESEGVSSDEVSVETGRGPIEKHLRKDYLDEAMANYNRMIELTMPPADIHGKGMVEEILKHRAQKDSNGFRTVLYSIRTANGNEITDVEHDDLVCNALLKLADDKLARWARATTTKHGCIYDLTRWMARRERISQCGVRDACLSSLSSVSSGTHVKCRQTKLLGKDQKQSKGKSNSPNKRKSNPMGIHKYIVNVLWNVKEALKVDKQNGNNLWAKAIYKEISALMDYKTFKQVAKGKIAKVKLTHQCAPLWMIFDVKQDHRRKARLVIGIHVVQTDSHDTYASNMKAVSARILMLIASADKLDVLTGNIKNAYLYTRTTCLL